MANAYAAFSLGDAALNGRVLADFAIDYLKTLSGSDVSQTGITLAELGAGDYLIMCPNVVEPSICRLHLNSDPGKAARMRMVPYDCATVVYPESTVTEAFTLNDDAATGKTISDFTIDYLKTFQNVSIPHTGLSLVELGDGDYALSKSLTTQAICRLHLTSSAAARAVVVFNPLDMIPNTSIPKRHQVALALAARLATVTVANGYRTDIGLDVHEWITTPLDPNESVLRVDYRDDSETVEYSAVGEHLHTLGVTLRVVCQNNEDYEALRIVRDAMADIYEAIQSDVTFGGLAQDTNQSGAVKAEKGEAGDTAAAATVSYAIEYTTAPGMP